MRRVVGIVAPLALACMAASAWAYEVQLPVLYHEDFEKQGALANWGPTDPAQWKIGEAEGGNKMLSLFVKGSKYQPKLRSPLSFALIRNHVVGDFVLDLRMKSTAKELGHQELCVIFGYQSPTRFYYAHLAPKPDDTAHHIMVVNDKEPRPITSERNEGVTWGDKWHQVRVTHCPGDGSIKVYFDDATVLTAEDQTFGWGRVGIGSFDDTGDFDDVHLRGLKVEPPRPEPVPPRKPPTRKPPVRRPGR